MPRSHDEGGSALIGAVLIIMILSMLGMVSLNVAAQEIESVAAARDEAIARHLAEAGADLVMRWFHDPATAPGGAARALFAMRQEGPDGSPSFFDLDGRSQFTGTEAHPDLLYDAARPADDRLLNDASSGWFRDIGTPGRLTRLAVYGPTSPGLLCTVKVTAESHKLTRTLVVQLDARPLPPIRAGVQIGNSNPVPATPRPLPVSVHWGDLVVNGDARLGALRDIPVKALLAPVTGQAYAEMTHREDRWFNLLIGGEALLAPQPSGSEPVPSNVQIRQMPLPGLPLDRWDYQALKEAALRQGTYYARGQDGLLYRHGLIEPGLGVPATDAVRSEGLGDHRGLVFVDTLDQAPPRSDNLGTLTLEAGYMEGIFVINADIRFAPASAGSSIPAYSPPVEGQAQDMEVKPSPIQLAGINMHGALITPGHLTLEGASRAYGALVVGGTVEQATDTDAHLEVWYDADYGKGLFQGIPLVHLGTGVWPETG